MKIYTKLSGHFDGHNFVVDIADVFEYTGEMALLCGASAAQNAAQQQQAAFFQQATQQAQQVFGASSQVFQQLQSTFAPTIAAGPSQKGFSAGEESALNSQAITQGGIAARNAKQAAGDAIAAQGGGNNPALTSGTNAGVEANIAASSAENTANNLNTIQLNNYATGRQNYDTAVAGAAGATNTFNPATSATNAGTTAGEASANTANQIASQNNSWVQAVTGALGGAVGNFVGGGLGKLVTGGGGSGSNGGSISTAPSSVNNGEYIPQ